MKRFGAYFGIFLILTCFQPFESEASSSAVNTVVIDPGHGGRDAGAVGRHSLEKDVALAISLKLGEYINQHLPEVEVLFTRKKDVFVPLHERAQIANSNNADLFISIHCNSTNSSRARGTETFVMGLHRSEANLEVARRENKSILYEDDYLETYDGFDPRSPEANIIFSLYQNAYLDQSLQVASLVQDQFRDRARRIDRGVKQAGFLVLYEITMPGILVETGFLSNPAEEQFLISESGQAYIASAIFRAIRDYKEDQDALFAEQSHNRNAYNNSLSGITESAQDASASGTDSHATADSNPDPDMTETEDADITFRVQFTSMAEKLSSDDSRFNGLDDVYVYHYEGLYRYTAGQASTLEQANVIQKKLQDTGYQDAFVVAFLDDERISARKAIRLLQERETQ